MKINVKSLILSAAFLAGSSSMVFAHEFWVNTINAEEGKPTTIEVGYSDNFPTAEAIAEDRLSIFGKPILTSKKGSLKLKETSLNYEYLSEEALEKGSYIATATYKPTMWSEGADGKSAMQSRAQMKDAVFCENWSRFAKEIINVNASDDDFVTKPVGHALELVPVKNPSEAKVGEPFTIQVLFNGRPRIGAKVYGTFSGFSKVSSTKAFYAVSNDKGQVNLIPLKDGQWFLTAEYSRPFPDKTQCDTDNYDASLSFKISD